MTDRPKIADFMATVLVTLSPDMEISKAMKILLDERLPGAPVVDAKGQLVGRSVEEGLPGAGVKFELLLGMGHRSGDRRRDGARPAQARRTRDRLPHVAGRDHDRTCDRAGHAADD